jgi:hypothetical protein
MTATVHRLLTERKHIALLGAVAALAAPAVASAAGVGSSGDGRATAGTEGGAAANDRPAPRVRLRADGSKAKAATDQTRAIGDAVALDGPLLDPVHRLTPLIARTTAVTEHRLEVKARKQREARKAKAEEEKFAHLPGGVSIGTLEAIAACESGGDPGAISSDGTYRGKYQFDQGTWESVGGHGDPAAAPEDEQDYRAALLYSEAGSSPWPICGQ